jgi:hypothetical protein
MANQPLGFQQEQWHGSFWKATGTFELSFDDKSRRAVEKPPGHRSLKTA